MTFYPFWIKRCHYKPINEDRGSFVLLVNNKELMVIEGITFFYPCFLTEFFHHSFSCIYFSLLIFIIVERKKSTKMFLVFVVCSSLDVGVSIILTWHEVLGDVFSFLSLFSFLSFFFFLKRINEFTVWISSWKAEDLREIWRKIWISVKKHNFFENL